MPSEKITLLVVDDEPQTLDLIKAMLEPEGYNIITAADGRTALNLFKETSPSLVLLDIRLPDIDGLTLFRLMREGSKVPIIIVSGKVESTDEIAGLEAGANDYITKPFSQGVLIAHVRAALRSTLSMQNSDKRPPFRCKELTIYFDRNMVTLNNENIDLTAIEHRLLTFLALHAGEVIPASEILREVWGEDYIDDIHLVQVNIWRLRRKLNDVKGLKYIRTKSGQGYILNQ